MLVTTSEPRVEVARGPQVLSVRIRGYTYGLVCATCGVGYCNHDAGTDPAEPCTGEFGEVLVDGPSPEYSAVTTWVDGIQWSIEYRDYTSGVFHLRRPDQPDHVIVRGPLVRHRFTGLTCPHCFRHHDTKGCTP